MHPNDLHRRRPANSKVRNEVSDPDALLLVSVKVFDNWFVRLTSVDPVPQTVETRVSFFDTLYAWPNQSLWKHFKCDGDGEWIRRAISSGTLSFVHDGSYMRKVAPKLCSTGFVLSCSRTGMQATGTLVEKSNAADNYRAEALGAVAGLLVIKAATTKSYRYLKSSQGTATTWA